MAAPREALTLRRIVGGKGGLILCLVCGFLAALCIGIGYSNLRTAQRSLDWPSTSGEVVHAEVEEHVTVSRDKDGKRTSTSVTYESSIVYAYRVGGKEYEARRVRFDWELDRADAEATVAKYPVGSGVSVYYDPADPADAVLEPGGDVYVYQVLIGLGVFFIAIPVVFFAGRGLVLVYLSGFKLTIDKDMAGRVSAAQGWRAKWAACNWIQRIALAITIPLLSAALLGWMTFGFLLFSQGLDGYLHPDGAQIWPETSGLVVTSEMKRILVKKSDTQGRGGTYDRFDLHIVVEYRVLANRYELVERSSVTEDEAQAQAILARFARGRYVSVYYDPNDPGDAALTPNEPAGIASAVIGGLMMAPWLGAGLVFVGLWLKKRYLSPAPPAGTG